MVQSSALPKQMMQSREPLPPPALPSTAVPGSASLAARA